ncbi:MAG TPA: hypothetical protein VN843_34440 [Anaerolineales bacterium]|nr:hypothetical protein [Anaerolineales bacterium]
MKTEVSVILDSNFHTDVDGQTQPIKATLSKRTLTLRANMFVVVRVDVDQLKAAIEVLEKKSDELSEKP